MQINHGVMIIMNVTLITKKLLIQYLIIINTSCTFLIKHIFIVLTMSILFEIPPTYCRMEVTRMDPGFSKRMVQ